MPTAASAVLTDKEVICVAHLRANCSEPLHPSDTYWLTEQTYMNFARATKGSKHKSLALLQNAIKWRRERQPFNITAAEVCDVAALGLCYRHGRCRNGNPVIYLTIGPTNSFAATKREALTLFLLEESLREGHTQVTWVSDWRFLCDEAWKDEEGKKTREAIDKALQEYYPGVLRAMLLVDAPRLIRFGFAALGPFLPPLMKDAIVLVPSQQLPQHIDCCELPDYFPGGQAEPKVVPHNVRESRPVAMKRSKEEKTPLISGDEYF